MGCRGATMTEMKYLEITHRQLEEGYLRLDGNPALDIAIAHRLPFCVIRTTEHGTYIVQDPESAEQKLEE